MQPVTAPSWKRNAGLHGMCASWQELESVSGVDSVGLASAMAGEPGIQLRRGWLARPARAVTHPGSLVSETLKTDAVVGREHMQTTPLENAPPLW